MATILRGIPSIGNRVIPSIKPVETLESDDGLFTSKDLYYRPTSASRRTYKRPNNTGLYIRPS